VATLAIDAGQTATRALIADGRVSRRATVGGVLRMQGQGTAGDVAAVLVEAVAAAGPLPVPEPPTGVGLSGFEAATESQLNEIAERLGAAGAGRLAIAGDGLTALLGALGDRPGAVVAAGTGAVALARDGSRFARVDGWGALLGDAGSGFAIGRDGLASALREADGRGGSAALLEAAAERFDGIERLPAAIYGTSSPSRAVASFSVDVAAAARAGDEAAVAILGAAGRELAVSAAAALGRLFEPGAAVAVSHSGNVFRAGPALTGPFERAVAELWPGAETVPPAGDPLAGAQLLAELAPGLPPTPGILWRPT
jgi:N-acetylglucosamine kinase-like BadF-type ATPase